MPTDSKMLDNFVRMGQEILSCDWTSYYGSDFTRVAPSPPGVGYAQPGFVGRDYRGLVFVGQNPGVGAGRADEHRLWKREFQKWHDQGTVAAYTDVFQFWRRDLNEWDVWKTYIKPVLHHLGFTEDHIGYLNLCKNATTTNTSPTPHMYRSDWAWTRRQLELLEPRVVVAGGKEVAKQLNKRLTTDWPAPSFIVLPQNRARARPGLTYDALVRERAHEADLLANDIRKALHGRA
jgi:hypothetical protein